DGRSGRPRGRLAARRTAAASVIDAGGTVALRGSVSDALCGGPGLLNLPNRLAVAHMPPAKECNMSSSFADIGVSTTVANALLARGATAPFPIQELVIPDALAGRDVLAKSPTGSGKTLAFAVPIAERVEAS